jgi:hypothetical protein
MEVRPFEFRPIEVRPAEVHHEEIRLVEVRLSESDPRSFTSKSSAPSRFAPWRSGTILRFFPRHWFHAPTHCWMILRCSSSATDFPPFCTCSAE